MIFDEWKYDLHVINNFKNIKINWSFLQESVKHEKCLARANWPSVTAILAAYNIVFAKINIKNIRLGILTGYLSFTVNTKKLIKNILYSI